MFFFHKHIVMTVSNAGEKRLKNAGTSPDNSRWQMFGIYPTPDSSRQEMYAYSFANVCFFLHVKRMAPECKKLIFYRCNIKQLTRPDFYSSDSSFSQSISLLTLFLQGYQVLCIYWEGGVCFLNIFYSGKYFLRN